MFLSPLCIILECILYSLPLLCNLLGTFVLLKYLFFSQMVSWLFMLSLCNVLSTLWLNFHSVFFQDIFSIQAHLSLGWSDLSSLFSLCKQILHIEIICFLLLPIEIVCLSIHISSALAQCLVRINHAINVNWIAMNPHAKLI